MDDSPSYNQLLNELRLANTEIHILRQRIKDLESSLAVNLTETYELRRKVKALEIAQIPDSEPTWVVMHQLIKDGVTNLMRIPKFLWDSRPHVTITYGWSKDDK